MSRRLFFLRHIATGVTVMRNHRQERLLKKLRSLIVCVTCSVPLAAAQLPVALGSASSFSVLAGSTVTSTGATVVNGDLGVSPGTAVVGFPPGQVVGGAIHSADTAAGLAQSSLTTAYNDAAGRTLPITVSGDLGGQTLTPGFYKSTSSLGITGILRLDGQGNANSVFIFQIASALIHSQRQSGDLAGRRAGRQYLLAGR